MEGVGKKPGGAVHSLRSSKAGIVELCQRGDRTIGRVAKDFDLTEIAVSEWVKQAERDVRLGKWG
jgi:transposase